MDNDQSARSIADFFESKPKPAQSSGPATTLGHAFGASDPALSALGSPGAVSAAASEPLVATPDQEGRGWWDLLKNVKNVDKLRSRKPGIKVKEDEAKMKEDGTWGPSWAGPVTGVLSGLTTALKHDPITSGGAGVAERAMTGGVDTAMAFAPKWAQFADKLTGKSLSGGIKSTVGASFAIGDALVHGDTRALSDYSDKAHSGEYGIAAGLASRAGDWIGETAFDMFDDSHNLMLGPEQIPSFAEMERRIAAQRGNGG
jgi:hypothetical protein